MQLQLPQLWLFDLRPLMQDERWRAFLPDNVTGNCVNIRIMRMWE